MNIRYPIYEGVYRILTNHCNFRFDICFILFSDPDSVPQFSESRRNVLNFKTG